MCGSIAIYLATTYIFDIISLYLYENDFYKMKGDSYEE